MDFDPSSPKIVLLNKVCALSENKKNVKKKKKINKVWFSHDFPKQDPFSRICSM